MRHPVRGLRRLDEKLPHPPNEIPFRVVRFRSHQFCGIEFHRVPFLRRTSFPANPARSHLAGQQKARAPKSLAAGKCLTNMDLPLAACEPSPPDRSSPGLRLARDLLGTQTFDQLWVPPHPIPTRARFDFAARTHRERIHSVVFDPPNFGASRELISSTQRNVKKRMALRVIFFAPNYFAVILCAGKSMWLGCSPFRRHSSV